MAICSQPVLTASQLLNATNGDIILVFCPPGTSVTKQTTGPVLRVSEMYVSVRQVQVCSILWRPTEQINMEQSFVEATAGAGEKRKSILNPTALECCAFKVILKVSLSNG